MVTINADDNNNQDGQFTMNYATYYPFRISDADYPSDNSGYVYCLVSRRNKDFTYIGQTENLKQRHRQHNAGSASIGTANLYNRPYAVAAYISGLAHLSKSERMSLEAQWRTYRNQLNSDDPYQIICQGERVVQDYNIIASQNNRPERIHFVTKYVPITNNNND